MTNLEKFKRGITADNLCDKINCCECPMFGKHDSHSPCFVRLKKWAEQESKKE